MSKIIAIIGPAGSGKDTVADKIISRQFQSQKVSLADPLKEFCRDVFRFSPSQLWGPSEYRNAIDDRFTISRLACLRYIFPQILDGYKEVLHSRATAVYRYRQRAPFWIEQVCPNSDYRVCLDLLDLWLEKILKSRTITPRLCLQTLGTEWGRKICEDLWIDCLIRKFSDKLQSFQAYIVVPDVRFPNEAAKIREFGGEIWDIRRPQTQTHNWSTHASEACYSSGMLEPYVSRIIDNSGTLADLTRTVQINLDILEQCR